MARVLHLILPIILSLKQIVRSQPERIWTLINPFLDESTNLFIWGGGNLGIIQNILKSNLKTTSPNLTNLENIMEDREYRDQEIHLVYTESILDLNFKLDQISKMMRPNTPNRKFRKFFFLQSKDQNLTLLKPVSFPFDSQIYLFTQNGSRIFEMYSVGNRTFFGQAKLFDLWSLRSNLQNGHLRISIYCHPQNEVMVDYLGMRVSCTSIMKQIDKFQFIYLDIFVYLLNFTYTPIENKNHPFDETLNQFGGGPEPQRLLENYLVDLESYPHPLQELVAKRFAYIQPIFKYGKLSVYFRQPPANTVRSLFTEPFNFWVWISAILTFFGFFVSFFTIQIIRAYIHVGTFPTPQSISDLAFKLLGAFSSNGWAWNISPVAPSIKILFLMSSLFMLVLQASYLGQITTTLSFIVLPITSFGGLIDFNFTFVADTSMGSIFTYILYLQELYHFKEKPLGFPHEINETSLYNAIENSRTVLMTIPRYFLASEVEHSAICPFISRLQIKEVNIIQGSFVLPKYSPYQEAFNLNAIKMIEGGITRRLILQYRGTPDFINCLEMGRLKYLELTIKDVFMPFAILLLGLILASLAYIIEYFSNGTCHNKI